MTNNKQWRTYMKCMMKLITLYAKFLKKIIRKFENGKGLSSIYKLFDEFLLKILHGKM